jgi:hypothetical protein
MLVGQHKMAELLARKIRRAMDPPQSVASFRRAARLRHRSGIEDTDQTAMALRRRLHGQQMTDQQRQPIAALPQPIQQTNVGDIDQTDSHGPGRSRAQPPFAQAVGEHQPQQNHRRGDLAPPGECPGGAGIGRQRLGSAEAFDGAVPVVVQQRIGSHPMLESETIPGCKGKFLAPMSQRRHQVRHRRVRSVLAQQPCGTEAVVPAALAASHHNGTPSGYILLGSLCTREEKRRRVRISSNAEADR